MTHEQAAYNYRTILEDLRCWPLVKDEAHKKFIFNLNLIPGCIITGDHQEMLALVTISASAVNLKMYPGAQQAYGRALSHLGIQLGKYGQPPKPKGSFT